MVSKHKWWIIAAIGIVNLAWYVFGSSSFLAFWLTKDQQAQIYFEKGEYQLASSFYQSPMWKAYSAYLAGDFASVISLLDEREDDESKFLTANAYAYSGQFEKATTLYTQLEENTRFSDAAVKNLAVMKEAIQKVKDAPPESMETEKKVDDRQLALDEEQSEVGQPLQLSDKAWLKQVRQDPSKFLRQKFQQEYANDQG